MSSLFLMVTITDRRSTDAFLQLYQQRGVDVNLRTVGSGTAVRETLATLGLEKTEKAVLLAVVTEDTWKAVRTDLRRKMSIDVPDRKSTRLNSSHRHTSRMPSSA